MALDFESKLNRVPVSVVIPCYRCADTIERAVESVIAQTASPAEVWLVEDGSGDDGRTLAVLHELRQRHSGEVSIEVISLGKNFGCAVARNTGWDASTQPYIAFLDADDSWHPKKLEIQHSWMRDRPEVAMTGHDWIWVRSEHPDPGLSQGQRAWHVSRRQQLLSNRFLTPTVMLRRELSYRFAKKELDSDGELWLRIVLDGHSAWRLDQSLVYLYKAPFGHSGLSGNLWQVQKAVLNTYWRQVREGRLGLMAFALLVPWLLAKHLRRLVISGVRAKGLLLV
jgi:glycosyltransferase involved in cell wall biosynthesis